MTFPYTESSDWDRYRVFLAVARSGTLVGAAEALGMGLSSVHRHVQALEAELGVRLFERRGRSRVLTALGEQALVHATQVEEAVLHLERRAAGQDAVARGVVSITAPDTVASALLVPRLPVIRERLPEVRLDVLVDNRAFRLGRGEADIALRPGKRPDEPDVVVRPMAEMTGAFYAADSYLERRGRPRRKADLRGHDIVTVDPGLAHIRYGQMVAGCTDPARHVLRSPSLLLQAEAVAAGVGIGALPCFLMAARPGTRRLFKPEPEGTLWLAYHVDHKHTARVRAVVDMLGELLGSSGQWSKNASTR